MLKHHDTRPMPKWISRPLQALKIKPHWFWVYVDVKRKEDCWEWLGNTIPSESKQSPQGYGRFRYRGKARLAHRVAFCLHNEIDITTLEWPERIILHTCDNPSCCNPYHLRLGTHAENMKDCRGKKRQRSPRGEETNTAILNRVQVKAIRRRIVKGNVSLRQLALKYGVSRNTIYAIRDRKIWAWLED